MNFFYDEISKSLSSEIPQSKNSYLKAMLDLEKFEIGQSYVTSKIKNKKNDTLVVNIQGGSPGIDISDSLFNFIEIPKIAYVRTMIDNTILVRKLPVLGVKEWLLIYEDTLFLLAVKEKYDELEILCVF
ncbi:MAG: hypothetical protein QOK71_02665 [Nitrososphaeraceae archaeon]|jgi:hypothetical protein|nr:hypothetical protein [Nitrososphaeraceae archaeon]MDW3603704.1 hypothetical protein [Nitrososphaeraceae archaeon]MDW3610997.1 hypothetical protein [Nitrososphaeraceae archaeon]MDW3630317.1 hypothetical protein [Nitrososphaeraceae archaeon]